MPDVVLSTLNAKYIHAAFGLRYLFANLGELQSRAGILEFDINQRPLEIAERVLSQHPRIVGFGVYIWNTKQTGEVVAILKKVRPELAVVLGGPEVSFETELQPITALADHVITGEADLEFAAVCRRLLAGEVVREKIIPAPLPTFSELALPYDCYSDQDIAHRLVYVEASRGCPFSCEFCLSSLDIPVRQVPLARLLPELEKLLGRGVRQFKFVDRTFNLDLKVSRTVLEFCLQHWKPGLFFHFEMVPDRLPAELREIIKRFPPGALQLEVGVQTFNPEVGALISRRQNYQRLEENLRFLHTETGVHVHADLIVGLPSESLESFGEGFDRLLSLGPQEIQVGVLKRLRGTPIVRHDHEWQMVYNPEPPYEILQNRLIDFAAMQRLRRFARFWDLVGNSGNFVTSKELLWSASGLPGEDGARSPFRSFLAWSDWAYERLRRTDSIALVRLMELFFRFLTEERRLVPALVGARLWADYQRGDRKETPSFLAPFLPREAAVRKRAPTDGIPRRQARHLQA